MDRSNRGRRALIGIALAAIAPWAAAQSRPDTAALLSAQRDAMHVLAAMDGVWRGESRVVLPGGQVRAGIQTERMGPMLGGTLKVIEGRGYDDQGQVAFNAFAVVSFDPEAKTYSIRSYAQGTPATSSSSPRPMASRGKCPPARRRSATPPRSATAGCTRSATAS